MKNTKYKILNTKYTSGFVSLFAVLISLVILTITLGISTVAFKENVLANSAKQGSYAFFAADTGLECALYQDSLGLFASTNLSSRFWCAEKKITALGSDDIFNFNFDLEMNGESRCVEVLVKKNVPIPDPNPLNAGATIPATQIFSNGYNVDCGEVADILNLPNKNIVNRLLVATYPEVASTGSSVIGGSGGLGSGGVGVGIDPSVDPADPVDPLNPRDPRGPRDPRDPVDPFDPVVGPGLDVSSEISGEGGIPGSFVAPQGGGGTSEVQFEMSL